MTWLVFVLARPPEKPLRCIMCQMTNLNPFASRRFDLVTPKLSEHFADDTGLSALACQY